jgi:hypothetical protein
MSHTEPLDIGISSYVTLILYISSFITVKRNISPTREISCNKGILTGAYHKSLLKEYMGLPDVK